MFYWYAWEKWGSYFSLVACEDCLEVCFSGLVLESNQCQSWRDTHLKIKSWPVNRIVEFIPELNCSEFSKDASCLAWPWYFICKVNSTNRALLLKNTLCTLSHGFGISCNAFLKLWYLARCLYYRAFVELLSCKSDSWRCICTNVLLVYEGEVGKLVQPGGMWGLSWGLLCWISVRKYLCMVPCHSCHIYGIRTSRSKNVWWMLKSHQLGVAMQVTKGRLLS